MEKHLLPTILFIFACLLIRFLWNRHKQATVFFMFDDTTISENKHQTEAFSFRFSTFYKEKDCLSVLEGTEKPTDFVARLKCARTIHMVFIPHSESSQKMMQLHRILLQHQDDIIASFVIVAPDKDVPEVTLLLENLDASFEPLEKFVFIEIYQEEIF